MERISKYRQPLTVQQFVSGFELEVPVFGSEDPQTIGAIGIEIQGRRALADQILTYNSVFDDSYGFYDFGGENPAAADLAMKIRERRSLLWVLTVSAELTSE
jgi:hypothetical protein